MIVPKEYHTLVKLFDNFKKQSQLFQKQLLISIQHNPYILTSNAFIFYNDLLLFLRIQKAIKDTKNITAVLTIVIGIFYFSVHAF